MALWAKRIGIGIAVAILAPLVLLRGCGVQEGTPTVTVAVEGSGGRAALLRDSRKVAKAAVGACDGQMGLLGDLLGIDGPSGVNLVIAAADGDKNRATYNCDTQEIRPR